MLGHPGISLDPPHIQRKVERSEHGKTVGVRTISREVVQVNHVAAQGDATAVRVELFLTTQPLNDYTPNIHACVDDDIV